MTENAEEKMIRETQLARKEYMKTYMREYRKKNPRKFYEAQIRHLQKKLDELCIEESENCRLSENSDDILSV